MNIELKEKLLSVVRNSQDMAKELSSVEAWNSWDEVIKNIETMNNFVQNLLALSTVYSKEMGDVSEEDQIRTIVAILDDAITLNWILEMVDDVILKLIINLALTNLKKFLGKDLRMAEIKDYIDAGQTYTHIISDITTTLRKK